MTLIDIIVIAVIIVFGAIGLKNGLVLSLFKIASFFLSAILSIMFYPIVSAFLLKTPLFSNIKLGILQNMMSQEKEILGNASKATVDTVVKGMNAPDFIKDIIIGQLKNTSKMGEVIGYQKIASEISDVMAHLIINLTSLVVLFILIRIGLIFAKFLLEEITKLPVVKEVDRTSGLIFGALEGILMIFIAFTVLMLFQTSPEFQSIFGAIDNSSIAKFLYQNNLIVKIMFANKAAI